MAGRRRRISKQHPRTRSSGIEEPGPGKQSFALNLRVTVSQVP